MQVIEEGLRWKEGAIDVEDVWGIYSRLACYGFGAEQEVQLPNFEKRRRMIQTDHIN